MTKRYREALEAVEVVDEPGGQRPESFHWRGQRYRVVQVIGHWREDPGWWRRPDGQPVRIEQTDLWRVEAGGGPGPSANGRPLTGVYELVQRGDDWKLDRIWD